MDKKNIMIIEDERIDPKVLSAFLNIEADIEEYYDSLTSSRKVY